MAKPDRHFETTTVQTSLSQRSVRSGLVAVAAQPLKLVIGIGGTMILARELVPADFGLLAMVQPLLTIVDSLSNLGLETATIQRQNLTQDEVSRIFWFSLKINVLIILGMMLTGPLLAWFYGQPELTSIVLCLAVGSASLCMSFQQMSLLKRQMQFEILTLIEVVALIVSTALAISTAWLGLGYWSLILQVTTFQTIKGIAYWLRCDWRPSGFNPSFQLTPDLRSMLSYGIHLTGYRCITRVGMEMDRILLGYFSSANALGLYSVAYQWAYFPFWQIYYPLFDVAVASFSRSLSEPERYRTYCRSIFSVIFAIYMPALAFLFVTAQEVILLGLGEQWLEIVPMFRVLTVAVFVGGIYRVTKWVYVSAGETQHQFRWSLIHTPIMITAVAIGVQWGAFGVAVGYTTGMCLLSYPSVIHCVRKVPLTLADFLSSVWRPAISALLSAILLYTVQSSLPSSKILIVILGTESLIYAVSYIGLWLLLPGGYTETRKIVRILLRRKL